MPSPPKANLPEEKKGRLDARVDRWESFRPRPAWPHEVATPTPHRTEPREVALRNPYSGPCPHRERLDHKLDTQTLPQWRPALRLWRPMAPRDTFSQDRGETRDPCASSACGISGQYARDATGPFLNLINPDGGCVHSRQGQAAIRAGAPSRSIQP